MLGVSLLALAAVAASPASAAPRDVADVRAGSVLLQPDGTLTATVRVRCDEGWVAGDVDVIVDQGLSIFADGTALALVPCDGRWHRVEVSLVVRAGSFQPGKVTFSLLQFSVTDEVFGDFVGVNDSGATARLKLAT